MGRSTRRPSVSSPLQAALRAASAAYGGGDLSTAALTLDSILRERPDQPQALHLRGMVARRQGDGTRAVAWLRAAADRLPDDAGVRSNLSGALLDMGRAEEAATAARAALACDGTLAAAHNNLGMALREMGQLREAIAAYRAGQREDSPAELLYNLGNALAAAQRYGESVGAYRAALARNPDFAEAWANLALALLDIGQASDARQAAEQGVRLRPTLAETLYAWGCVRLEQGERAGAEETLRRALRALPGHAGARRQLAMALVADSRASEAAETLLEPVRQLRALDAPAAHASFQRVSRPKLRHDADQLEYMAGHKIGAVPAAAPELFRAAASRLSDDAVHPIGDVAPPPLLTRLYNRLLHIEEAQAVPGGALNAALDWAGIEARFLAAAPGHVAFDDFLNAEALARLQRFCLLSTIWYQLDFPSEVGASMANGFATPLLFQIAANLRERLPRVFGPHLLTSCWAYRYLADGSGLDLHIDAATVSLNFWITPDSANRDPARGGLEMWNRAGPVDFFSHPLDEKVEILRRITEEPGARAERVPYRCNRAIVFRSTMIHRTDAFRFDTDFASRRTNVTFLFGRPS